MSTKSKRVLFVLTNHDRKGDQPSGFWLAEATHPHHVLSEAGFSVDFVSPKGGQSPVDPASIDLRDSINAAFWNDASLRRAIEQTKNPSEVDANDYAAIFYAGGHGAMWDLPDSVEIATLAARIYERGGVVGAVCHGPAGLVNIELEGGTHLVSGKDVAAFTNDEERAVKLEDVVPFLLVDRLVERGARHQAAPNWQPKVVVSERLVTGQNPASATGVGEAMATLLRSLG
jgi:putative intracellular protease/amidase